MNNRIAKLSTLSMLVLCLSSCETLAPQDATTNELVIDAINESLKEDNLHKDKNKISADQALSTLIVDEAITFEVDEEKFDISVKDVEINSFLLGLVDSTDYNLIVSPDLNLKISLQLNNVTISEVLHALTQIYPVVVKQNNNLFLVSSAETTTAVYPVDYLNLLRDGTSQTRVAGQSISASSDQSSSNSQSNGTNTTGGENNVTQINSSNVQTTSKTDFWKELTTSLNLIIKDEDRASVVVSPHAGIVVVRSLPQTQALIKKYLGVTQKSLDRQVIIEAKIIEIRLNNGYQAGVDWSKMNSISGGDSLTINQQGQAIEQESRDFPLNGMFSLLYEGTSFTSAINLLESQGDVQVLSSPRVSTVNNQKAIIKVGSDEFFVTDISSTTVTGTSTATTPNVTLTPFFSGISLDVTPQVNTNGDIVLHIHPIVSEVEDQKKTLALGQDEFVLPLALTNVRESDSIVRTRNGRVVVIGGLMQNKVFEESTSTPFLGDIPLLGRLFTQTRESQVKSELVILLKAHLVDPNESDLQLNQIKNRFDQF